jgi:dynein heavy chain, axonemal
MGMTADLQPAFLKERPGKPDTPDNLKQFFIDCSRDNLHLVLCMSPVNPKFPERARKFPGLVSGTTIDWFLPWPEQALIDVSKGFLQEYKVEATPEAKEQLIQHMGTAHSLVVAVCDEYKLSNRRYVYQTPKSYLSFIANYMQLYKLKLSILQRSETNINRGLEKLIKGAEDVEAMKKVLAIEQIKLDKASQDVNKMIASLQISQAEAEVESAKVSVIKINCNAEAVRIGKEKAEVSLSPFISLFYLSISNIIVYLTPFLSFFNHSAKVTWRKPSPSLTRRLKPLTLSSLLILTK